MSDPHLYDKQIFIILFAKSIFHHLNAKQKCCLKVSGRSICRYKLRIFAKYIHNYQSFGHICLPVKMIVQNTK